MAASPSKNRPSYKYDFVNKLPADFTCPICLDAVRGARQTGCCGNHLCQFCAETLAASRNACPICNHKDFSSMPDLYFRRKLNEMHVYCTHKSQGCSWTGEINDIEKHSESCDFELIACPYGCAQRVQRRALDEHNSLCKKRPFSCEYCQYKATYEVVTEKHWRGCEMFPVDCPNGCSQSGKITRSDLQSHLTECLLQEVECEFSYAGCDVKPIREDYEKHMSKNTRYHLSLVSTQMQQLLKAVTTKERELDELKLEVDHLRKQMATIKVSPYHEAGIFVLQNLDNYREVAWCSPPFLSRPHGYKMGFKVLRKAGNLQIFVYLIGGEYDDKLHWPFHGKISIVVLNQLQDSKGSFDYTYQFNYRGGTPLHIAGRPELGQHNGDMPTSSRYLSIKDLELSHNSACQYMVNNCLRFRVTKITTDPVAVTPSPQPQDYEIMQ